MDIQISASELAAKLQKGEKPLLLDVREREEHEFVSLPDSTLIPLGEIMQRAAEIESWKGKEVVVYCHHGMRSMHAISRLQILGFTDLRNLHGGIDAWSVEVDSSKPRY
ncbi:rhodanese-like domain-containing protein [Pedosphaera parvula]|uniref:Rhodanese domain protein n=1 Tax=Pedosphaera parvula (strain Ellin514) TaxID=320771 RepID=B9XG95_PEDPL|nr:rhodanese-like domain-containing protein [Pedosphaera parvula]EEF61257.1 Rhodanese domain protein [Pedosphaera parvula Ellin514]